MTKENQSNGEKPEERKKRLSKEYRERLRESLKQDPEKLKIWKERQKKYQKNYLSKPETKKKIAEKRQTKEYKEYNAQKACEYRKKDKWRDYFNGYYKNWLKDDVNYLSHRCRCNLRRKLKETKLWIEAQSNNQSAEHILTLTNLANFFKSKELLKREDRKLMSLLISICNDSINITFIKKHKNNKANNAPMKKQIEIAAKLEEKSPFILGGLVEFLQSLEEN